MSEKGNPPVQHLVPLALSLNERRQRHMKATVGLEVDHKLHNVHYVVLLGPRDTDCIIIHGMYMNKQLKQSSALTQYNTVNYTIYMVCVYNMDTFNKMKYKHFGLIATPPLLFQ